MQTNKSIALCLPNFPNIRSDIMLYFCMRILLSWLTACVWVTREAGIQRIDRWLQIWVAEVEGQADVVTEDVIGLWRNDDSHVEGNHHATFAEKVNII